MFLKEKFKLSSSVNQYVLAYFVFVLLFYGIRYTADWASYTQMIEHPELSPDLLFRFLAERVRGECGFSYIYQLHIVLMGGIYLLLLKRTVGCPVLAIIYAIDIYLFMANQIRFYLAWPLMLLAILSFYRKEFVAFALLAFLAVMSHKSLILLFPAALVCDWALHRWPFSRALVILTAITLASGLLTWVDFGSGFWLGRLQVYQEMGKDVTFIRAVYNQLPYLVCLALVVSVHRRVLKAFPNVLTEDGTYRYLLVLSLTPLLFVGFSFYMMVFSQRFSQSMILIWFMYFYWCYRKYSDVTLKEGIRIASVVVFLINPFFACVSALIKENYFNCSEIFKMLLSYSLFS